MVLRQAQEWYPWLHRCGVARGSDVGSLSDQTGWLINKLVEESPRFTHKLIPIPLLAKSLPQYFYVMRKTIV